MIDLNLSQSLARYSSISCVALETKVQIGLKGRIRTYDRLVPNELLYPAELLSGFINKLKNVLFFFSNVYSYVSLSYLSIL